MTAAHQRFRHPGSGIIALFLCAVILAGPGCVLSGLQRGKQADPHARTLINRVHAFNAQISTSRGTGELTLTRGFRKERYKIAWAARSPNRLRLTLLMTGHPVETIAASGQRVTFISHTGGHKPHSTISPDPDLDPYIKIPLRLSELVSLLLGKVPERSFDRAWTLPEKPDTVFASRSFSSTIQEFSTDQTGRPLRYRVLDKKMNVIFSIRYSRFFIRDNFILPGVITIKDGDQRVLELSLKNLMPNIPVKESVFRLTRS